MWNEEQIAAKQAAKDAMGDLDSTYAQRAMEIDAIKAQLESTAATGRRAQAVAVAEYQLAQAQRRPSPPPRTPHAHPTRPAPHAHCAPPAHSTHASAPADSAPHAAPLAPLHPPPPARRPAPPRPRAPTPPRRRAPAPPHRAVPRRPPGPLTRRTVHETRRAASAQASAKRERERADQVMTLQDNIEEIQNHLASRPSVLNTPRPRIATRRLASRRAATAAHVATHHSRRPRTCSGLDPLGPGGWMGPREERPRRMGSEARPKPRRGGALPPRAAA